MIIGIDASRAFGSERTGTENYSYYLISHILRLPESKKHQFVLFLRPNVTIPAWNMLSGNQQERAEWPDNVQMRVIHWRYLWTQVGLAAATWQEKLDLLWIPAHTLPVLRRKRGLKTVVTIHGMEYEWLPQYQNLLQRWYLPLSTKYAAIAADKIIAVSNFTKKQLVEMLHATSKKIKVIHEGVETSGLGNQVVRASERQSVGVSQVQRALNKWKLRSKQYVLFVGTVQPRKNLAFLIDSFAQIPVSIRKQLRLVIAGQEGWMAEEAYAAPAKYGVADQVLFLGRVSEAELATLYAGALFYAQPSITEGFGLPVLEAMERRVPVISSDGGALPEVIGTAGLICPLTTDSWVAGMRRMIGEPRLRERLAAAGKWRVRELSWEKAARATLEYLTS